ncbi:MAG: ThiF family adenylyltransferase [Nitrospirales bacterium]|nr:ThiF family adenylyltransferase [Nitrospirales bacterium]
MSHQLINRSSDLKKLRDEGYELRIISGFLVMQHVPYVNSRQEVKFASLVSELTLAGDKTTKPSTHVVHFTGEHPCKKDGSPLKEIVNASSENKLADGIVAHHSFSSKPKEGYKDYYLKMTSYANMISSHAQALNPGITAKTFAVIESDDKDSVFNYIDTASSRAEIIGVTGKLELQKLAIVGVGGTGSYILDFVSKTPVKEIHLYDGDIFLQHNAFRSPGSPSIDELGEQPKKVEYFKKIYSKMHNGIFDHPYPIDSTNIEELREMNFIFLCIHGGNEKKVIFRKLEEYGIPFVDVGMGLDIVEENLTLGGQVRVTTSSSGKRDHVESRVSFSDGNGKNEYDQNIQIADLNALNAALSVIKWKKIFGFYRDFENEHFSVYTIDGNKIINEDKP